MGITQLIVLTGEEVRLPEGWSLDGIRRAVAESVIEPKRFVNHAASILARLDASEDGLFPSCDELHDRGIDLDALAQAFNNGLDADGFADLLANQNAQTVNWALQHLNEQHELLEQYPDPFDRALLRHEEACC